MGLVRLEFVVLASQCYVQLIDPGCNLEKLDFGELCPVMYAVPLAHVQSGSTVQIMCCCTHLKIPLFNLCFLQSVDLVGL